ncbi:hypothetical protein X566_00420 [Afipia sp. P52-10]|nr:hypothetical protein X566_00420 [Afipia sp. P52-10]
MMNSICVVELVTLATIGLTQLLPALLLDEDAVTESVGAVHQGGVPTDVRTGDDHEHVELLGNENKAELRMLSAHIVWVQSSIEIAIGSSCGTTQGQKRAIFRKQWHRLSRRVCNAVGRNASELRNRS